MNNHTSHPAIEFRDVSIAFDGDVLLDHISFTVPRGKMRILIGPSKSGKTTMMKTWPDNLAFPVFNSKLYPRAQL